MLTERNANRNSVMLSGNDTNAKLESSGRNEQHQNDNCLGICKILFSLNFFKIQLKVEK